MEIPSTCSEIPAALRRARRKEHAQHPHSERAFKGIKSVPIGRASDVFEYEVPAFLRAGALTWTSYMYPGSTSGPVGGGASTLLLLWL